MASGGFDVVLETPAEDAPDPESDGPCDAGSGPDQMTASEDSVEEQACLSHGAWVVSEARKTLHKVGSCWRRPGLHYRRFTLLDQEEITDPKAKSLLYSRLCSDCFPRPPELETLSSEGEVGNLEQRGRGWKPVGFGITNWLVGCSGVFPGLALRRAPVRRLRVARWFCEADSSPIESGKLSFCTHDCLK